MPKGKKKISKADLFLPQLAKEVLTKFFDGEKACKIAIPDYFTIAEVNDLVKAVKSFKHLVYTKEEGVKYISTANVAVKYADNTCFLVITSK